MKKKNGCNKGPPGLAGGFSVDDELASINAIGKCSRQQTKRQAPHEMQQLQLQPEQPPQALQDLQPLAQPLQPEQPPQPRAYCTPGSRGSRLSLSKTKNVVKLTSMISSSLKVIFGPAAASRNGTSAAGPTPPVADALPASAIDTPTTPATGTAFFRCFCFVCRIVEPHVSREECV
jgi:hypothetical protein